MKKLLLTKIRLSWYFVIFFVAYVILVRLLPEYKFESAALTLFSVNSFLYGFYISPILGAQKGRIEDLHKIVRTEANAIFTMVLGTKNLPEELRNRLQDMFASYLEACSKNKLKASERQYEALITYTAEYKGAQKEAMDKLLEKLVANQQNRTMLNMQMSNKVYSNEWMIIEVLFSITLSFILLLDNGSSWILTIVTALLCTGLSMLVLILVKLSTLTHKKAKEIWKPFNNLLATHFYRINDFESESN